MRLISSLFIATLFTFGVGKYHFGQDSELKVGKSLAKLIERSRLPASLKGLTVTIPIGQVAYIDEDTNIDKLIIYGELRCKTSTASPIVELKVKTIIVHGKFICGSAQNPYRKKLIISLKHSASDPVPNPSYRGIMVMMGGELSLYGDTSKSGWTKLDQTANPGDDFIHLVSRKKLKSKLIFFRKSPSSIRTTAPTLARSWKVGDDIVVGPTGFDPSEAESFKIVGFDATEPNKVYLDRQIQFTHYGEKQIIDSNSMGRVTFDERAEVANLTRSIVIRADETNGPIDESDGPNAQLGGHVMSHHGASSYISGVEFYKMGHAGVMARYPFHWHHAGDASGQFIKNSSIHHSYQRCITIHKTNNVLVSNNVCYNFKGHGFFLEDGDETGNTLIRNLAIEAKAPSENKILLASDDIYNSETAGRFPSVSAFWISNPDNTVIHNTASGSVGSGFWMSFENQIKDGAGNVLASPIITNTRNFSYNTAHTMKVGITWDGAATAGLTGNPRNPHDRYLQSAHYRPGETPTFVGLKAYKNTLTGIYFRGQTVRFKRLISGDNGWSFWCGYNQIVQDSILIGETENSSEDINSYFYNNTNGSRFRKTGMVMYDGPFEVHNTDFVGYSTIPRMTEIRNSTYDTVVVPFTSTGGTNKYTNFSSGLSFSPEPLHRIHVQSEHIYKDRQYLHSGTLRDLDGTLTGRGPGSIAVAKRSLAITAQSDCTEGGDSFHNFVLCSSNHTEGSFNFMKWGGPVSAWSTPYIARRNDGVFTYPKNEWNYVKYSPNNVFSTVNSHDFTYEVLPYDQYYDDVDKGVTPQVEANSESENPFSPVVKFIAYGKNCRLGDDAVEVNSVQELYTQNHTAYYTDGEDFYMRLLPNERWRMFSDAQFIQATANATNNRFPIVCDDEPIAKRIVGDIDSVIRTSNTTTVSGYACNYTHPSSIRVKLYAVGPQIYVTKGKDMNKTTQTNQYYYELSDVYSGQVSDENTAFKCGSVKTSGRRFTFSIPNEDLSPYGQHKFYVKGMSNSTNRDRFISGSGKYPVFLGTIYRNR